ncbi:MAG TPA: TonB-dependent receptor [Gemmatimonadaceae bacterium]|nr:TonB-dependent receptor [Gemmatimonadaceae bacterium]
MPAGSRRVYRHLHRGILAILAATTGGVFTPVHAQRPRAVALTDSGATSRGSRSGDVLGRLVTLHLTDATLETALRVLARECDLRLSYSSDVVPVARRVSVARTLATAGDVLRELLRGTGIDYVVTPSGYVVLVRGPMDAQLPVEDTATANGDGVPHVRERAPVRTQIMDRVLVMGTPASGAPERELSSAVTVLTASQIAAMGPASMEDLLRVGIPGVVAWDLGISGPFAQLGSVRGSSSFTANYLKTYVDGVELASPYLLFAIDPYSIERIEVIRGPQGSALYGSDAISGVVHVVTRRGSPAMHWRPQVDAMLSAGLVESRYVEGPSGSQRHSAMVSTGGGLTSLGIGGTWASTGEIVPEGSSGYRGLYGAARHLAGWLRVEGMLRYADVRFSAPSNPLLGFTDTSNTELQAVRPVPDDQRIENETFGLTLEARPSEAMRHTLVVGLDRHAGAIPPQREPATVADALLGATRERVSKLSFRYSTGLRLFARGTTAGTLTLGADRTEAVRERLGTFAVSGGLGTELSALYRDDVSNTGVFGQFKIDVGRALFLTAGLRGDRNSSFGDETGTAWSPMLGAAWTRDIGAATLKLRSAYGRGIRPPAPSARKALTTLTYTQVENPALEPESQSGVEGGVELYVGDRASIAMTGYTQDANGLIQQVILDRSTTRAIQYQNVGRISNRGIEVEGSARYGALRAGLGFGFTDSRVLALSSTYSGELKVGDRVPEVPVASGQGWVSWTLGRAEVTLGSTYIGEWTGYDWQEFVRDESTTGSSAPPIRSYLREYAPLLRPFLSLSQTLASEVRWFGRIDNITNQQRNERDNLQITAGRTMTVGIRIGR